MTETSAVWSVMALSSALTATIPDSSTGSSVVVQPRRASARSVFRTASCSIALAIRWRRPRASAASATPRMAALSASVPPLVKTISEGSPLRSAEIAVRASSSVALACWPKKCTLDAFPNTSRDTRAIVSATSGDRGVVAL